MIAALLTGRIRRCGLLGYRSGRSPSYRCGRTASAGPGSAEDAQLAAASLKVSVIWAGRTNCLLLAVLQKRRHLRRPNVRCRRCAKGRACSRPERCL